MKVKQRHDYTEEQKAELTKRALAGDTTVAKDLADAYLPEALKAISWYIRRAPKKVDDIFGAGLEGLVVACNRACTGHLKDEHIDKYIKGVVRWSVQDFLRRDYLIPIPKNEFSKRIKKWNEENIIHPNAPIKEFDSLKVHTDGGIDGIAIMVSFENLIENTAFDISCTDEPRSAISDLFIKLELTEREIEIVSMRLEDFTMEEIGTAIGLSKMRIKQILDVVKDKLRHAGFNEPTAKITGTKACTQCGVDKSLSDYYKRSDQSRETHKSICKECMKQAREIACVLE